MTDDSKLMLGPKTDLTAWLKRLECKVVAEQSKSDQRFMDKWESLRNEAVKVKKNPDEVQPPYEFPHKWITFLTEDPIMPDTLSAFDNRKYENEYNLIVSKFGEWWSQYLPQTFIGNLQKNLYSYKVHEIIEKLKVEFGNQNGVSLSKRIMNANQTVTANFKDAIQWWLSVEQKMNQSKILCQQLLGRDLTYDDSMIALAIEHFPPETWGSVLKMTNEDFTCDKIKAFIANTYQHKSLLEINPSKKRQVETLELNASHIQTKKKWKKTPSNKGTEEKKHPYPYECRFCYKVGHKKSDCRLFLSEKEKNVFRSCIKTNPITKVTGTEPITWSMDKEGKITVNHIQQTNKMDVDESEDGYSTPFSSPFTEYIGSDDDIDKVENDVDTKVSVTHIEKEVKAKSKVVTFNVSLYKAVNQIRFLQKEAKIIGKAIDEAVSSSIPDLLKSETYGSDHWVLDGGCGGHLTGSSRNVLSQKPKTNIVYNFGNNTKLRSAHVGHSILWFKSPGQIKPFTFKDVHYVPGSTGNILSENLLKVKGYKVTDSQCGMHKYVFDNNNYLQFVATAINGTYYIKNHSIQERQINCNNVKFAPIKKDVITNVAYATKVFKEWHLKLGHINKATQMLMMTEGQYDGIPFIDRKVLRQIGTHCQVCAIMKKKRMSFRKKVGSRDPNPMSTLHADTKGAMKHPGQYGKLSNLKYWMDVIDDCTSMTWIYLFKSKTEVPDKLKDLITLIDTQHGTKVTCLRTDCGTEFVNSTMKKFYKAKGIKAHMSNTYYHEENGAAERDNRTKLEGIRCALETAQMNVKWWPEALMYKNYVQVRTPVARLNWISPYEAAHKVSPNLSKLKPWGSVCYAHVPEEKRNDKSLSARAIRCRFLGISEEYKAYRLYDEVNNKFLISRDVTFDTVYLQDMLARAFEQKAQPLTEEEKEQIMQLGPDLPSQTDDMMYHSPLENDIPAESILEDALESYESTDLVGVVPLRSEKHPSAIDRTMGLVEVNPHLRKLTKRNISSVSNEFSSNDHTHKVRVVSKVKTLPISEPLQLSNQEKILSTPRPTRLRKPPGYLVDFACAAAHVGMSSGSPIVLSHSDMSKLIDKYGHGEADDIVNLFAGHLQTIKSKELKEVYIPKGIKKALSCADKDMWQAALDSEYNSLIDNGTWHLDHLPSGSVAIPCQWIFNVKYNSDGSIDRYKARLVALGNRQEYGVYYDKSILQ